VSLIVKKYWRDSPNTRVIMPDSSERHLHWLVPARSVGDPHAQVPYVCDVSCLTEKLRLDDVDQDNAARVSVQQHPVRILEAPKFRSMSQDSSCVFSYC
jgi:hypothetical protein